MGIANLLFQFDTRVVAVKKREELFQGFSTLGPDEEDVVQKPVPCPRFESRSLEYVLLPLSHEDVSVRGSEFLTHGGPLYLEVYVSVELEVVLPEANFQ